MVSPRALMVVAAFATFAMALTAGTADAATKKKRTVQGYTYVQAPRAAGNTVYVSRGEDGRTRTKIIVQKRSYLDGGTEVLPGQRKFTDYVYPPGYSATDVLGSRFNSDRQPLNGRFDFGTSRF